MLVICASCAPLRCMHTDRHVFTACTDTLMHTSTPTDLHTHIGAHAHALTYKHSDIHMHTHSLTHTHTHTHILRGHKPQMCAHTRTHTGMHLHPPTHTHTHTHTLTHSLTHSLTLSLYPKSQQGCIPVRNSNTLSFSKVVLPSLLLVPNIGQISVDICLDVIFVVATFTP